MRVIPTLFLHYSYTAFLHSISCCRVVYGRIFLCFGGQDSDVALIPNFEIQSSREVTHFDVVRSIFQDTFYNVRFPIDDDFALFVFDTESLAYARAHGGEYKA